MHGRSHAAHRAPALPPLPLVLAQAFAAAATAVAVRLVAAPHPLQMRSCTSASQALRAVVQPRTS